ncbi:MAG TPA: YidC/Oxa1 family membrane protein insertase [Actinomycetota bacterium]|nr:YidC/Oxa1 family membrane protein insertase [Actinomycetota bacterium]
MAQFFGAVQNALGAALNAIYTVIPSYGVAIILLTVAVRAVLIPLTLKQIRSMTAMQTLAPEQKKIQQKYKQLQAKVQDRQELMKIRQQMNQEIMALFKEHGVNPAGGCLPLLAQMPAFIALYSILRTSIVVVPLVATMVGGGTIPSDPQTAFGTTNLRSIICTPQQLPSVNGSNPSVIDCKVTVGSQTTIKSFEIANFVDSHKYPAQQIAIANTPWITRCVPFVDVSAGPQNAKINFHCLSQLGTGHLPRNGKLFKALTEDKAKFLTMHLGCTAPQVASKTRVVECTRKTGDGGGAHAVPYYILILLVIGSTYYQSRQMNQRVTASGQALPQQQQMMTRIMPLFFGLISLNFPAGLNLYFLATNLWTIGQQALVYRSQDAKAGPPGSKPKPKPKVEEAPAKKLVAETPPPAVTPPARPQGSRKRKKRKKRR